MRCALCSRSCSQRSPRIDAPAASAPPAVRRGDRNRGGLLTIALSGLTALGAQVVWTRLLSLLLGTSVYTFSIILAVFLLGLGLAAAPDRFSRATQDPRVVLGWCQALLVVAIAWAGFSIDAWLPFWPVNPLLRPIRGSRSSSISCAGCGPCCPRRCLWGASFPLALAAAAPHHQDSGRAVGAVYAANTVGAIIGALTFSMILIPRVGTLWSQRILIAIAAVAAIVMMAASLRGTIAAGRRCRWSRALARSRQFRL